MTDLEMTKLCAEAMGIANIYETPDGGYDPLTSDAQAMALVKRFPVNIWNGDVPAKRYRVVCSWREEGVLKEIGSWNDDINRAIVECVSKMQSRKVSPD